MLDRVTHDLRVRTVVEDLWLWRRAHGLTQKAAARRLKVGRVSLQAMERGELEPPSDRAWTRISDPSRPLMLALARRRSGLTVPEVVRLLRASRVSLYSWERNGDARLLAFWSRRGFTF